MSTPGIVESALDDEDVVERVSLGGDDAAFVTPTRTLVYRADGLLSDESVDEYPHEAKQLSVAEGRRKTKIELEYVGGANESMTVPDDHLHAVLEPVLAGLLRNRSVTGEDESIAGAFRFSELTLVITDERLIRHLGEAVWDDTFESYEFGDVTDLEYEEGSVATQIVLTVDGRKQRIKTPNDRTPEVRDLLESALLTYHGVDSIEELSGPEDDEEDGDDGGPEDGDSVVEFDEGVDPLTTDGPGEGADEPQPEEGAGGGERTAATSAAPDGSTVGGGTATAGGDGATAAEPDAGTADSGDAVADPDPDGVDAGTDGAGATGSGSDPVAPAEGSGGEGGTSTDRATEADPEGARSAEADPEGSHTTAADPERSGTTDADPGTTRTTESEPGTDPAGGESPDASASPAGDTGGEDAGDDDPVEDVPFTETFEPIDEGIDPEVRSELEDLRTAIERQNELLARQQETIEELVAELRDRR